MSNLFPRRYIFPGMGHSTISPPPQMALVRTEWIEALDFLLLPYNSEKNDLHSEFSAEELVTASQCFNFCKEFKNSSLEYFSLNISEAVIVCRLYLTTVKKEDWPLLLGRTSIMDRVLSKKLKEL